jgi:Hint module
LKYSEVISVPHGKNSVAATFIHFVTENGREVKMTPSHILHAGICDSDSSSDSKRLPLKSAKDVSVGECVMTVSGSEKVVESYTVSGYGIYTVVSMEEFIVVNGIIASPFAISHTFANIYYNLHRFQHGLFSLKNAPIFAEIDASLGTSVLV